MPQGNKYPMRVLHLEGAGTERVAKINMDSGEIKEDNPIRNGCSGVWRKQEKRNRI